MAWSLSRFRADDLVQIRSKEEILATLDEHGCLDGMPFMPEMLQYCGQRFAVSAVAHKSCDTACYTGGRRLSTTVHLMGVRCDGAAHGGCEAECTIFWKDAWLKPADRKDQAEGSTTPAPVVSGKCSEAELFAQTQSSSGENGKEQRYSCQATRLLEASQRLPWWDVRQYWFDIITGNRTAGSVMRVLLLAALRRAVVRSPLGYRLLENCYNKIHQWLTGRPSPWIKGKLPAGKPTPVVQLELQPGEEVRIKPRQEIEETIDENSRNRGLSIDKEMASYCGRVVKVRKTVRKIIDESTGEMRQMKQPCIMLDGVFCNAEYSESRLMCPRAVPPYWREIWLERVNGNGCR